MFTLDLKGKVSWVTGGSRGIGRASCIALAKAGSKVVIGYRENDCEAHNTLKEITDSGGKALLVKADLINLHEAENAYKKISATFGDVDILVNSAGAVISQMFLFLESDEWLKMFDSNLKTTINACTVTLPSMIVKRTGKIINVSSSAAANPDVGQSAYAASKGAVNALTKSMAVEFGSKNISVNCLAPGLVITDMTKEIRERRKETLFQKQIFKRCSTTEEIAGWIVFLASDYASFMTGQVLYVDGGLKMA